MDTKTFAADIRQMMIDWNNATPAQREEALTYAAKLAARKANG